jgi:hypothetical protein
MHRHKRSAMMHVPANGYHRNTPPRGLAIGRRTWRREGVRGMRYEVVLAKAHPEAKLDTRLLRCARWVAGIDNERLSRSLHLSALIETTTYETSRVRTLQYLILSRYSKYLVSHKYKKIDFSETGPHGGDEPWHDIYPTHDLSRWTLSSQLSMV